MPTLGGSGQSEKQWSSEDFYTGSKSRAYPTYHPRIEKISGQSKYASAADEAIARPFKSVGKVGLNLFDIGGAEQQTREAREAAEVGQPPQPGAIQMLQNLQLPWMQAEEGESLGGVPGMGLVGNGIDFLSHLASPITQEKDRPAGIYAQELFNKMRDTPDEQLSEPMRQVKALNQGLFAQPADSPIMQGKQIGEMYKQFLRAEGHSRGTSNVLMAETLGEGPDFSPIGGALQGYALVSAMLRRAIGSLPINDQLGVLRDEEGNTDEEIGEERADIRARWKSGELNDEEARDMIAMSSFALTNPNPITVGDEWGPVDTIANLAVAMGGEMASDPLTYMTVGVGSVAKLGVGTAARTIVAVDRAVGKAAVAAAAKAAGHVTPEAVAKFATSAPGREASEAAIKAFTSQSEELARSQVGGNILLRNVPKASTAAAKATGKVDASAVTAYDRLSAIQSMGGHGQSIYADAIKEGIQASGIAGHIAVKAPTIVKMGQAIDKMTDPLSLFGYWKTGKQVPMIMSRMAAHGYTDAIGWRVTRSLDDKLTRAGVQTERVQAARSIAAGNHTIQAADAKNTQRMVSVNSAFIGPETPTEAALRHAGRSNGEIRRIVKDQVDRTLEFIMPATKGGAAEMTAQWRERAVKQMVDFGADEAVAREVAADMSEREMRGLANDHWGLMIDQVDGIKRTAMGNPTPTWDPKKISRITFMGPRQMAQQDARGIREAIIQGRVDVVRVAVRRYRDLNQFISESLDDAELVQQVSHVLDQLDGHLPVKIEDMTDMPQGIVDWDNAHPDYGLMLRPDDNDLLVPIRNLDGKVVGANSWIDHVTERTPAQEISRFKAMREDLLRGVSGGELERNAARRFAFNMAERVGLSEAESASIMRSIRETAEVVETSPRGLTAEQILKATSDAKAISPQRKMLASRVVRDAMFDAYENEMRLVGALPKLTGWVKKSAATVPGGDTIAWASDFLYPLARFKKNPLFFLQEVPEAPFFLALQGRYPISGMMPGRLASGMEASRLPGVSQVGRAARESKERTALWNERTMVVMDRMTRTSPNAEYDQFELAELTKLGLTTAANMTDPRTGLGKLLKGWTSLPARKAQNVAIAVRAEFGEQWRRSLMQNAPEQWRAVRAFYPDEMSDGEVAVEWALDLMARSDPDAVYTRLSPDSFRPSHIGRRAEVSDELLRYFVYGENNGKTWTDLTTDIKTGQVSIDQLRRDLMDRGADPDYVERATQRLTFGTADEFYSAANGLGVHRDTTDAWRASNRVAAELQGLSEEEYLVRNFVGRPLSTDQMGNIVGDTLFDDIVLSMKARGKAIPDSNSPEVAQLKVVTNDFITGVLRPAPVPLKPVTGPIDIPTDPAELLTWSQQPDLMPDHLVALRARNEEIKRLLADPATPRNMRGALNKESKALDKAIPEVSRTIASPTILRDGVPHRIVTVPGTMPKGTPEDAKKAAAKVRGWEKTRVERAANPRLHRPPTREVSGKGEAVPGYNLRFEEDPYGGYYDTPGENMGRASELGSTDLRSVQVEDGNGKVVGFVYAKLDPEDNSLTVVQSQVLDKHGRKGIGNWMYRQLEEKTGATFKPARDQSETARALWAQPDRPFGPPKRTVREYKTANELGHLQPVGEPMMRDPSSLSLTGRRLEEERYLDVTDAPDGVIREPVLVDPQGRIIDGNDRVQLARQMGVQVPTQVVDYPGPGGVPPARFGFDETGRRTLPPKFEAEEGYVYRTVGQNRLGQDWDKNTFVSRDPKGIYATTSDAVMLRTREDASPWEAAAGGVDADVNSTSQKLIWAEDIEMLGDDGKWYPVLPPGRDQPLYQTALHTVGVTTPRQYKRQIMTMMDPVAMEKRGMRAMTEKDAKLAIEWYDHMRRATFSLVDDNLTGDERIMAAARVLVAFGTTQLNTSPADGFRHVFKAYGMKARGEELQLGEARNIVQQAVGLNPEQLHALVWNDQSKISQMGIAQKLFDFIDSLTGSKTRTNGILGPKGDWGPVAVDIHTKRDFGYLDPAMGDWVYRLVEIQKGTTLVHGVKSTFVKEGGAPGAEIGHFVIEMSDGTTEVIPSEHIGKGVPSDGEYDFGVELGNDIRDYFNETNFMGRQWSSYEVQALGWYRMQLLKSSEGDAGEVANAVYEQSRWMGSNDIFPGHNAPLLEQHPWDAVHPDHAHVIVTNGAHHASDEAEMASGARIITKLDHQGVVGGERRPVTTIETLGDITAAEQYAAHYGLLSEQDNVTLMRDITGKPKAPKYHGTGPGRGIGIAVDIPVRDMDHAEELLARLAAEEGGALRAIGSRSAVVPAPDGSLHIRTLWEPRLKGDRSEFNKALIESGLKDQLAGDAAIETRSVEYLRVENDWTASPDGSGYLDVIERGSHRHPVIRTPEQRVPLVAEYDAAYQAALKSGDAKAIKAAKKEMEVARATPSGRPASEVRQLARDARLRVRTEVSADFDKYAAREVRHERERVLGEARDANADELGTDPTYDAVLDRARASNGERLYERTPGGTVRAAVTRSQSADRRSQLYFNRAAVKPKSVLHEIIHKDIGWELDDSANRIIAGVFNGMEGTPYGTWVPGTALTERQHEWLVDQVFLWADNPDSVHPVLAPILKHLQGKLGAQSTLRSAGTAPARESIKRLDNELLILNAKRATLKTPKSIKKVDAAIAANRAARSAAEAEGKRLRALGGLSPEVKKVLDDLAASAGARSETRSSTFHAEEQDMLEWAQIAMGTAQRRSNDLVHMRGERSALERSINHPFLGLYPASYMYGKVLPYMAEFLMFRPFGIKTAPGNALAIGNRMHESFERQQQYDPELRDFLYKNEPFMRAMSLFVPGVPWDLPSGAPFWMRRIIETWLNNAEHRMYGEKEEEVDIPGLIANSALYNVTLRGPDSWDSIIGAAQQAPDILESMVTGKAQLPQPAGAGQPPQ